MQSGPHSAEFENKIRATNPGLASLLGLLEEERAEQTALAGDRRALLTESIRTLENLIKQDGVFTKQQVMTALRSYRPLYQFRADLLSFLKAEEEGRPVEPTAYDDLLRSLETFLKNPDLHDETPRALGLHFQTLICQLLPAKKEQVPAPAPIHPLQGHEDIFAG